MLVSNSIAINDLDIKIDELTKQRDKLLALPDEPGVGAVIKFQKQMSRTTYNYAAIRTVAGWFVTGRDGARSYTWSELIDYIGTSQINQVSGWRVVRDDTSTRVIAPKLTPARTLRITNAYDW